MLYTHGQFDLGAEIRDANGNACLIPTGRGHTSRPSFPPARHPIPISVALPHAPGTYTIDIKSSTVSILENQPLISVNVVGLTALPHLTLTDYTHHQPTALHRRGTGGDVGHDQGRQDDCLARYVALPDGTLNVTLAALPPNATQVVAHGKTSGVELWVAPP